MMFLVMLEWGGGTAPVVVYAESLEGAIKAADAVANRLPWGRVLTVEEVEA